MPINIFAYVDGYNLYNGIMEPVRDQFRRVVDTPLRKYLWLNLHKYILAFLPNDYNLVKIHYFTATVRNNPESKGRQQIYWKALETLPNFQKHLGRHISDGHGGYTEKQSDVNLALQMYCDSAEGVTSSVVLVSGDSDQVPTIRRIQALNRGVEFFAIFPPNRFSQDIADLVSRSYKTREPILLSSQFPETIHIEGRPDIIKPQKWS